MHHAHLVRRTVEGGRVSGWESPEYRRLSEQLEQAQGDASRQLEQRDWRTGWQQRQRSRSHRRPPRFQPPRFRSDPVKWTAKWLVIPVVTAFLLLLGAIELGPALAAAEGHGTAGYFVAEVEHCYKGNCGWTGNFVAPDGHVVLRNVSFVGPRVTLYQGDRLAALDTGDATNVYAKGSRNWIVDLAVLICGAIGFGWWAWLVPYRTVRRRARRDAFLIPRS